MTPHGAGTGYREHGLRLQIADLVAVNARLQRRVDDLERAADVNGSAYVFGWLLCFAAPIAAVAGFLLGRV